MGDENFEVESSTKYLSETDVQTNCDGRLSAQIRQNLLKFMLIKFLHHNLYNSKVNSSCGLLRNIP